MVTNDSAVCELCGLPADDHQHESFQFISLMDKVEQLGAEVRRSIHMLYRIRAESEHYIGLGNKHRNLKSIRKQGVLSLD